MTKRSVQVLLVLAMGSFCLAGGNVWEEKDFTKWSEKDVKKILSSSPWALPVRVSLPHAIPSFDAPGNERGGGAGQQGGSSGGPIGPGGGMLGSGGRADQVPPSLEVTVSWVSALPIKQAMARRRFGDEISMNPQAKALVERVEDHYVAAVAGLTRRMIQQAQDPLMSELRCGEKERLRPVKVEVQELGQSGVVYLLFQRSREIKLEDKQIEIFMNLGDVKITRRFKLKDMVFSGRLEI